MSVLLKALKNAGARNADDGRGGEGLALEPIASPERDQRAEPRTEWTAASSVESAMPLGVADLWERLFGGRSIVVPVAVFATIFLAAYGLWLWWQLRPAESVNATPVALTPPPPVAAVAPPLPPVAVAPTTNTVAEPAPAPTPASAAPAATAPPSPAPSARAAKPHRHTAAHRRVPPAASPPAPAAEGAPEPIGAAYAELVAGRYGEALVRYRAVAAREPNRIDAWLGLAAAAQGSGDSRTAAEAWRRALTLEPANAHAQAGLAALAEETDNASAEARLQGLIAAHPEAHLYFALGNHYARRQRWAEAQAAWFEAVRIAPADPDYSFNLAVALEHIGKPRDAARYYAKARELAAGRGRQGFDPALAAARARALAAD